VIEGHAKMVSHAGVRINLVRLGALALGLFFLGCASTGVRPIPSPPSTTGHAVPEEVGKLRAQVVQLRQQGRDRDALPIAERLLASVNEKAVGKESLEVATSLCFLAPVYESIGEPARAEELYLRALAIREKALGREHPDVASVLSNLAKLYHAHGEYRRAEELYRRALAIREKAPGAEQADVAAIMSDLAKLYQDRGNSVRAEELYQRALTIREKVPGAEQPDVAAIMSDLAKLYQDRGNYARAEELYQRALAIREKAPGAEQPDIAPIVSRLAALYYDRGDYARAEPLYRQALAIDEKALGAEHPDVATTLTNLALVDQKLGDYAEAERDYHRALAIDERALGAEHLAVATILNNLASLYDSRGEYAEAEQRYRRALAIREKALGPEHIDVATVVNNLAALYQSLGDYEHAKELYERSLSIREKVLGVDHPEVAASLNNLALLCESLGDYAQAEPRYRRALAIYKRTLGDNHPDTEAVSGNIAGLLLHQEKLDAAYPVLKQGDWPTGLGRYYLARHEYRSAHAQFLRAIEGAGRKGESRHLLASYVGLGLSLEGMGQLALAAESYHAAVELIEEQRSALGAAERTHFLEGGGGAGFKRILAYEGLVRTSVKLGDPSEALRWSEHTKARRLLEAMARSRIAPGVPAEVAEKEEGLITRLGALYRQREETLSKNPELFESIEREQIPRAREKLNEFVTDLRQQHPAYAAYKYPQPLGETEIALRPGEALLEFAVTEQETFAWLLRDGKVIKFTTIPVGREALDRQIREYRSLFQGISHTNDLRSDVEQGQRLYDLLVREFVSACVPGDTLIIVPDGSLGLIPFEALVMDAGSSHQANAGVRYLGDAFPIQYAQSATVLINARTLARRGADHKGQKLLVLADPVFGELDSRWPSKTAPPRVERRDEAATDKVGWRRLEKTEKLLRWLQEGFGAERVQGLSGLEASETSLRKQPLADYLYVVFATHGVLGGQLRYLQEPALVLSQVGVDSKDPDNDGYLTLSEVMGLNLNADVVALTACETGVGKELGGEGVMGMGWAFEYAGARNVVMSLWSVDQESAVQLTGSFFAQLRKGLGPQEALRQARAELREAGYRHPFFWAPFILVGEG
jgi:CHAT domain-containing protein/Tfp pilus assembly protein PilF